MKTVQFFIISIFLFTSTVVLGTEVQITSQARQLMTKLRSPDWDIIRDAQGLPFARLKYTQNTSSFDILPSSLIFDFSLNGIQMNRYGEYNGQCVSFVKLVTNSYNSTRQWKRGRQVLPNANIRSGTAIATFTNNGGYGSDGTGGAHTAILLNVTSQYITVIDQNWIAGDIINVVQYNNMKNKGRVGVHRIYFNNKKPPFNAYDYHVIEL